MKTNQGELRSRIRAGDAEAFGTLFDTYARAVYNHAYRLTGDWSTAEDLVSLTYLEAWRLRERLDAEGGSVRPWLLGLATNVARNTRRAARRHSDAIARLPRAEAEHDFADEVASRVDDQAQLAAVSTALQALRRPEREVLALCAWAGLDYASAAEPLGVPVGTVRSRLSRVRRKLAKGLEVACRTPLDLDPLQLCGVLLLPYGVDPGQGAVTVRPLDGRTVRARRQPEPRDEGAGGGRGEVVGQVRVFAVGGYEGGDHAVRQLVGADRRLKLDSPGRGVEFNVLGGVRDLFGWCDADSLEAGEHGVRGLPQPR